MLYKIELQKQEHYNFTFDLIKGLELPPILNNIRNRTHREEEYLELQSFTLAYIRCYLEVRIPLAIKRQELINIITTNSKAIIHYFFYLYLTENNLYFTHAKKYIIWLIDKLTDSIFILETLYNVGIDNRTYMRFLAVYNLYLFRIFKELYSKKDIRKINKLVFDYRYIVRRGIERLKEKDLPFLQHLNNIFFK